MTGPTLRRRGLGVIAVPVALALAFAPSAQADPTAERDGGRGPEADALQQYTGDRDELAPASDDPHAPSLVMPDSYPFQPELTIFPHDPDDTSYAGDLIGYADIAPRLTELMADSDRVSTQVVGQSSEDRDLYLVTVTAPESEPETAQQTAYREMIKNDPEGAAADPSLKADYKTPIWFSANIHGNEWEGTDGVLNYVEELAASTDDEVAELLEDHRLYFSMTLNPDGRVAGTRATARSFDANRDMITNVTPESMSYVEQSQELLALYASDIHGYTGNLQVEPTGPPHGENYEYDLFIPHNYALALQIEQDVVEADIPGNPLTPEGGILIPYRDIPSGWDDYPPIFTAQYAAFYGALTSTVELPLSRVDGVQTPERAAVNVAVSEQVVDTTVTYVSEHSDEILDNQIEFFRRGLSGEPKVPLTLDNIDGVEGPEQWKPLWDVADDQDQVTLPRAYVIPMGEDQRSLSDVRTLVTQLLDHDIEVGTLDADTTVDGTTYPTGSYVVDMHQPKRALANALLDLGSDISQKVPSMYDISAWSYSYLWGATVDKVGQVTDAPIGPWTPITEPDPQMSEPDAAYLVFDVAGVRDYRALNAMLDAGAVVWQLPTGAAVVAPESREVALEIAEELDIPLRGATTEDIATIRSGEAKDLEDFTLGYAGNQDHRDSLGELGFQAVAVTAEAIDTDPGVLDGLDVLWLGAGLDFDEDQVNGAEALQAWVDEGNAVVGAGAQAFATVERLGLLDATGVAGQRAGNGIVAIDTPEDSILANYAQDHSFIYPALSFTDLGDGTRAEQFYGRGNPLLAGHWRGSTQDDGPLAAGGNASVISADAVAKAMVFGTSVFFRTHPGGGQSQAGQALFWAAPEGDHPAPAPQLERVEGADRYDTAARLALETYEPGLEAVYLATGQDFPDALSGAALAGSQDVPMLLTQGSGLPQVTRAALTELAPQRVVVLGGQEVISENVMAQLRALGITPERLAGDDRYHTAARVSAQLAPSDTVYVATGADFPDALTASTYGGMEDAPVLLTRPDLLPRVSTAEIQRHRPAQVVVLGGDDAVEDEVLEQIRDLGYTVDRVDGEDRYETATLMAERWSGEDGADAAWVSTGKEYADALAGAPVAARAQAPMLLTRPDRLPSVTGTSLVELDPDLIGILGGTAAVSGDVVDAIGDLPWRE